MKAEIFPNRSWFLELAENVGHFRVSMEHIAFELQSNYYTAIQAELTKENLMCELKEPENYEVYPHAKRIGIVDEKLPQSIEAEEYQQAQKKLVFKNFIHAGGDYYQNKSIGIDLDENGVEPFMDIFGEKELAKDIKLEKGFTIASLLFHL